MDLCKLLVLLLSFIAYPFVDSKSTLHTVFTTECGSYFAWQSIGMVYSHRMSGQPGPLTRIASCTPDQWEKVSEEERSLVSTYVAPSYSKHPRTNDRYNAYNKPVAVIDWLARNDVKEDYVLIIDADMIMRKPFDPEEEGIKPGWAVSAYFGYMIGVRNELALKHIPEVMPRNDSFAGPIGRRSDQVGGFTMMHVDDLRRVAPLWLKYTEDVREDPDAWKLSGDQYATRKGSKPWISEMYGYSYACAKADVWHVVDRSAMLYPGYKVTDSPKVLHYGLHWKVDGTEFEFDKHWHYDFDPFQCPPWDLGKKSQGGLFAHPPRPSSLRTAGTDVHRVLLAIEPIVTLNKAFCERHRRRCPPSEQLSDECDKVDQYADELQDMLRAFEQNDERDDCLDKNPGCQKWASEGQCDMNPDYMWIACKMSCGKCRQPKDVLMASESLHPTPIRLLSGSDMHRKQHVDEKEYEDYEDEDYDGDNEQDAAEADYTEDGDENAADGDYGQDGKKQEDEMMEKDPLASFDENETQMSYQEKLRASRDRKRLGKVQSRQKVEQQKHALHTGVDGTNESTGMTSGSLEKENVEIESTGTNIESVELVGVTIPDLKLRCVRFPSWSAAQVQHCMELAEKQILYDPEIDDPEGGSSAELHAQAHRIVQGSHNMAKVLGERRAMVHKVPMEKQESHATASAWLGSISKQNLLMGAAFVAILFIILYLVGSTTHRRRRSRNTGLVNGLHNLGLLTGKKAFRLD